MNGTVKRFSEKHGYGFISTENGEAAFFHYSQLNIDGFKTINTGQKVKFEVVETEKGLRAINICLDNN